MLGIDNASTSDRIDPAYYFEQYGYHIGRQLFNTLTELDDSGKLIGGLAESWTSGQQLREWRLRLRKGVVFHNGKALQAQDVVYSLNHHRQKDSPSAVRGYMQQVKDVRADGSDTVVITLNAPNADFPYLLGEVNFGITPDGEDFNKGIGTGPFVLESFQPGVRTVTRRNPNYWKSDRAFVDRVETVAYNDSAARVAALLSGAVHFANRIAPNVVQRLAASPAVQIHRNKGSFQVTFPGLADREPFNNLDVRLALKYAIDREQLLQSLVNGYGTIGNDTPLFPTSPYYASDLPVHRYDPDKARFHWKKSGQTNPIVLSAADGATFASAVSAAELYQAAATKAGIPFRVNRVPADGYWTEVWLKHPFCASGWSNRPTADAYLSMINLSNAPWNEAHWKNERIDQLIVAARAEADDARRRQIYHDLQVLYQAEGSTVVPLYLDSVSASRRNVRGYVDVPGEVASRAAERIWFDA
ncbi:MAG: Heme-binding protein A [Paracidovorax wautersii]|uniref:Heme-binding protein A n=1 Tax=Paracidovorax wautersii TaxID=1177982 RepID=A0A7V8JQN6_9BURK|nr:MAG: Heme-binding protein A [Paracidovorax wautersii]